MGMQLSGSLVITGSIVSTGTITMSGSIASASYAGNTDLLNGLSSASYVFTSSLNTVSSSATSRITSLESASGSYSTRVTNLEATSSTVSSSYAATSASISNRVKLIEDQYATTGSNTLTGIQNITNTTLPTNFDSTAAVYTAGGLRVKGNTYISSSLWVKGDLTVYGTQSISYITASQLNISNNLISVNTALPAVRFGGLAVYDSGSTALTGSLLWDSQNNTWIYDNPSGSGNYDSAMVIMGPRNASSLGSEVGLSCNYLVQGHGHHHTTSSMIYHDGITTCIGNSKIAGNLNVAGNTCLGSGNFYVSTDSTFLTDKSYTFRDAVGIANPNGLSYCSAASTVISVGSMSNGNSIVTTGNVGIGTMAPSGSLHSYTSGTSDNQSYFEGNGAYLHVKGRADYAKLYIDGVSATRWSIGTEGGSDLKFKQADSSTKLTLFTTGEACFASSVCANYFYGATSIVAEGTLWSGGSIRKLNANQCLFFRNAGGDVEMTIGGAGVTTFACTICTPTIVSNNSSGFAACITSCSTDYTTYMRNMSSGFPLVLYTAPDANGATDDLKALKIARASNDNQYLALSLIYGGYGYGYKLAPRYYNGAAYVCGNPTVIDSYGNVGINCTAPFMPLTVGGCAGVDRLAINCTGFNSFGEHLQLRGCARFFGGHLRISSGGGDGNYLFLTHDDNNGYICICRTVYSGNIIVSPFGGVGINTSVVSSKLSVNSGINTSSANVLTLQQATNGAVKDAAAFGLSIQNGGEATNAADLYISTATGGALCERMRITSGGITCFNNTVCVPKIQINAGPSCGTLNITGYDNGGINIIDQRTSATGCYYSSITFRDYYLGESAQIRFYHNQYFGVGANSLRFAMSGNERILLAYDGNTCFANTVCAPTYGFTGASNSCIYANASYTYFVTSNANRLDIDVSGIATFYCKVCAPAYQAPAGFTSPAFYINYGCSYYDVAAGNYMGLLENGSISSYCNWFHSSMGPHATGGNTESMNFTCMRLIARYASPTGNTDSTPTYIRMAGYFYASGWYCFGSCVLLSGNGQMDGGRGYRTLVMPWISGNCFNSWGDVTGMGLFINSGGATVRIGSVYIQYK